MGFYNAYAKMNTKALTKARWRMRQQIRRGTGKTDYARRCQVITNVLDDRFNDLENLKRSRRAMQKRSLKINRESGMKV